MFFSGVARIPELGRGHVDIFGYKVSPNKFLLNVFAQILRRPHSESGRPPWLRQWCSLFYYWIDLAVYVIPNANSNKWAVPQNCFDFV